MAQCPKETDALTDVPESPYGALTSEVGHDGELLKAFPVDAEYLVLLLLYAVRAHLTALHVRPENLQNFVFWLSADTLLSLTLCKNNGQEQFLQLCNVLSGRCRYSKGYLNILLSEGLEKRRYFPGDEIYFIENHHFSSCSENGGVRFELLSHRVVILYKHIRIWFSTFKTPLNIEHVEQQTASLYVFKKPVSESLSLVSAFYETWNITGNE